MRDDGLNGTLFRIENVHLQIITINLALSPLPFFVLIHIAAHKKRDACKCDVKFVLHTFNIEMKRSEARKKNNNYGNDIYKVEKLWNTI